MNRITTIATCLTLLLSSCQSHKVAESSLSTIDVIPALSHARELRLSEIVDSIEYIKLETNPECLISSALRIIGNKYIVILNNRPAQIMLFNRNGKFIRLIGKTGKGPGEYINPLHIDLSLDENHILVYDGPLHQVMEFSTDGSLISVNNAPMYIKEVPYYIDHHTIVLMQGVWNDSLHFPRVVTWNLETTVKQSFFYIDFKRDRRADVDYCFGNDMYRFNDRILIKDALSDTIYQASPDGSINPVYALNAFTPKPTFYCTTQEDIEALSHISLAGFSPRFLFFLGSHKDRFHLVFNTSTGETFALPKLKNCSKSDNYPYGIINDLDGLGNYWFWKEADVRNNVLSKQLQVVDLKETVKSDCFLNAELKTNRYRDQLKKLVEESKENDNPIIRILHLK